MVATPFFGPFDVTRSTNFADNQCINLRPTITEIKDGRSSGVLYGTPGLDLLLTIGTGPINGMRPFLGRLYVVSTLQLWSVGTNWIAASVGPLAGIGGFVNLIDNGTQLAAFTNQGGWVIPAGHPLTGGSIGNTGYPLTGGTIGSGGINNAIGDFITLAPLDGTQTTPAILQVTGETGGVVTSVSVFQAGVFTVQPTGFIQLATSGVGSGFTYTAPTYGALISGGQNYGVGDTIVLTPIDGTQSAAAILTVTTISGSPLGSVTGFTILQTGAFQTNPTEFVQQSTTGSGSGFILTGPSYGGTLLPCRIALPFTPTTADPISAVFQDGFVLINEPGTNRLWQSEVLDLSVFPALNFATASADSDNVQALVAIHRLIFVVKQRTVEVWVDEGTSGFAFQPNPGVLVEHGTPAPESALRVGETLIFLSQTNEGDGVVIELVGWTPKRISTHAIETLIATAPTLADAYAYGYQQEGHQFYVLTLPSANLTLVYDKTESGLVGVPIWYQWLTFSAGQFNRHWGKSFAFFNETLVLGDYRNGRVYRINLDTLTDNGEARKWVRIWRALPQAVKQPVRFSSLQIDMQTGVGVPDGTAPLVVLEWSDDGGNNWSPEHFLPVGPPGATAQRVMFRRLGSTRRNSGLDRTFRLSSSDPFPVALTGAELDV